MSNWTAPRSWATNDLVSAADLNTHLRDNLNYLMLKPNTNTVTGITTNFSTTSTTFTDVTSFNIPSFTKFASTSRLLVLVRGVFTTSGPQPFLAVKLSTGPTEYEAGVVFSPTVSETHTAFILISGVAAGLHGINLRLRAGSAGTVNFEGGVYRQMIVLEGV